jgi:hypothetical protein
LLTLLRIREKESMSTAAPVQSVVDHKIVSISVDLGVTTPDGLRHIDFGLEKDTGDDDSVTWTINFAFQTRASTRDDFTDEVTLKIVIKTKDFEKAQATATQGLSEAQVDHLNGPVTAVCEQRAAGNASEAQVSQVAGRTIAKH